ncbi:hypothetical protein CHS0354_023762 [Potamilus streckersoni]|uniref:Large ribosomal subunit protein uL4m n=1 Tax=Potamilus streckersoni TaxID=2493646 RepID=A0AAE0VL22_9BIVA|nr:hypothetical protein CHS0354_023762 [Potamilus streckersoni]
MSLELKVFGRDGKETGEVISLDEGVFGIEPSESSVYLDVKSLLAARRQGTHKVKGRGEVRGGGRKPYKQKGTGGARRGSERSPLLVGGGSIFGPMPRDYKIKINKKVKSLARRSVLSAKLKDNEILVVEDFTFDEIKTKYFLSFIRDFGLISVKTLFLTMGKNEVLFKSDVDDHECIDKSIAN